MITRRLQKRALEEKRISVFAEDQRLLADMPVEEFKVADKYIRFVFEIS